MCENKKQTKTYYSELYNACKYMYEHQDEFNGFELCDSLKNDIGPLNERCKGLHSRLRSQYRILIGEEKTKSSMDSVRDFDIEPSIDRSSLKNSPNTLAYMLMVFHRYASKTDQKRTLRSVNVDKTHEMMDYLMEKINSGDVQCASYGLFGDIYNQLKRELQRKCQIEFQYKNQQNACNKLEIYNKRIDFFTEKLANDLKLYSEKVGKLSPTLQAWLYIDLCCWSILQFVISGIMRNKQDKHKLESIEKLNTEILRLIEQEKEVKKAVKLDGSQEEMIFKFYSYYYEKDRHLQDTAILDLISKREEKRKNPSHEYSLICFSLQKEKLEWQEILNLFSEGEKVKCLRSFKDSILKCHKGIFQFNEISGRNLNPEPITLRAFYKEIYMDDTLYNSRKSMTIFHDFLEQKNMGTGDYYFIDEKINAGNFREYGLSDEFSAKNNLQGNLYCLVCYILAVLNPPEMIDNFKSALGNISAVISEVYNEQIVAVDSKEEKELKKKIQETIQYQKNHVEELKNKDTKNIMELCFKLYKLKFPDGEL